MAPAAPRARPSVPGCSDSQAKKGWPSSRSIAWASERTWAACSDQLSDSCLASEARSWKLRMRVRLALRLSSSPAISLSPRLGGVPPRRFGDLRPGLGHAVLAVVFLHPVPGVRLDGLAAPHHRAVGLRLHDEVPAAADAGPAGQHRRLVLRDHRDLRQFLDMRIQHLRLAALALGDAARVSLARGDIVAVALDHRRRVGDGGIARLAGLRRPVARQGPGLGSAGLVAGRERFRETHPCGRDAAGRGARVGHHRPVAGHGHRGAHRRVAGVAVGIDMGRGADLAPFQGREPVRVVAGVGERQVARGALVRGRTTPRPARPPAPRSPARSPWRARRRARRRGTAPTSTDTRSSRRHPRRPRGSRPAPPARCRCRPPASARRPACARPPRPC